MKSENNRYGLAIILIFATLATCVKITAALKPELSGFDIASDDAGMLQAMWRKEHGLGYTFTGYTKESDLSAEGNAPLLTQASGVKWMMSIAGTAGLGRFDAYKLFYLLCVFTGTAGWLFLGKKLAGLGPLVFFGFALAFHYSSGRFKLADVFVWALVPYYLFFLVAACEENKKALSPAVAAAGAIGVLMAFFWYGGIYIGAAGALVILTIGRGSIFQRFLRGGLIAVAIFALEVWIQQGRIHLLGDLETGFYLLTTPIWNYLPAGAAFFGEVPDGRLLLNSPLPAKNFYFIFLALIPIFLSILSLAALKRNLLSAGQKNFFAIFFIHFCVLFLMLFYLSIRYVDPAIPNKVNNIVQAGRYMKHLATAGGLFWICAAWAWLGAALKGSFGKERRMIAVAVLFFFVGMAAGNAYFGITSCVSTTPAESAMLDAQYIPYKFIENDIRAYSRGTVRVFDIEHDLYYIDGSINIYNSYYNEAFLSETENTKTIFIYVVVRNNLRKSIWYTSPEMYVKDAMFMATALNLHKMADFDKGRIEVYGGEVGPYAKGELAAMNN